MTDHTERLEFHRDFPTCVAHGVMGCEDCEVKHVAMQDDDNPYASHDLELSAGELMAEHMGRIEFLGASHGERYLGTMSEDEAAARLAVQHKRDRERALYARFLDYVQFACPWSITGSFTFLELGELPSKLAYGCPICGCERTTAECVRCGTAALPVVMFR